MQESKRAVRVYRIFSVNHSGTLEKTLKEKSRPFSLALLLVNIRETVKIMLLGQ